MQDVISQCSGDEETWQRQEVNDQKRFTGVAILRIIHYVTLHMNYEYPNGDEET